MDYQFTMLTLDRVITTKSSGGEEQCPWSNLSLHTALNLSGGKLSNFAVADDDEKFQSGRYAPDATGQTLVNAVTFGNDTQATPAGTQLSFHNSSLIRAATPNADGTHDQFIALFPRQHIPNVTGPEMGGRYSVLLMPVARSNGSFPTFDLSKGYQFVKVQYIGRSADSTNYTPPAAVVCFATGTMIESAAGPCPVEDLLPGNLILTRDHGLQPLRWQGYSKVTSEGLELKPNLRPILIRAGALAPSTPGRDLVVSPQHRVLVRSRIAHRLFEDAEVLVAAKHLIGIPGIEVVAPAAGVTYWHLLFDRHEIVLSNGAWSESLYTGPQALQSVSDAARREILALFPELVAGSSPLPARRLLSGREARRLADRQLSNAGRRLLVETC